MMAVSREYVNIRASEILGQSELLELLKTLFPQSAKRVGGRTVNGAETIEVTVQTRSTAFEEIKTLITTKRQEGAHGFAAFTIGRYIRKYTAAELKNAEVLSLSISSHFEPAGEECGTIYETVCPYCNLGKQMSELILDLRRAPQHKDIAETIAWVEWVVSSRFVKEFTENRLSGAQFCPVFEFKNPAKRSKEWHQLKVTGNAGEISDQTLLGRDPFSSGEINWCCPLGHSVATQVLSEVYLNRDAWDGCDMAVTSSLFGQGRNLLRPIPLIIISQRMYRLLRAAGLKGYSVEVAHLV
jgi:hypothetical protein